MSRTQLAAAFVHETCLGSGPGINSTLRDGCLSCTLFQGARRAWDAVILSLSLRDEQHSGRGFRGLCVFRQLPSTNNSGQLSLPWRHRLKNTGLPQIILDKFADVFWPGAKPGIGGSLVHWSFQFRWNTERERSVSPVPFFLFISHP